ncbi:7-cyano-7-deazaguanine synthase [compost metagenome]
MTTLFHSLLACPSGHGAVVVMSGGMDSTIAARLAVEKYGAENVHALSFYYGQKQSIELEKAKENAASLGLAKHQLVDITFLGDMVRGVSANIVGGKAMPTIKDVLGDPAPSTEVPFRNAILIMVTASYAQANGLQTIFTGVQAQDEYSYWDTTPAFIEAMNGVISQNRMHNIKVHAPWQGVNKAQEIAVLVEMDGNADLLKNTITCYDPTGIVSCGKCPSCAERIANFAKAGLVDDIPYAINIPWDKLIK